MDEGNEGLRMSSQGRQMKKVFSGILFGVLVLCSAEAQASSLTIREVQLEGGISARILLDANVPKGGVTIDYVRDNVQFSILNSTIYPARIIHADGEGPKSFSKVFAYQYSPNLVRVRFTVDGKAEALKGKIKMALKGKSIEISFPELKGSLPADDSGEREASLLSKVLGRSEGEVKVASETSAKRVETATVNSANTAIQANPALGSPVTGGEKGRTKAPLTGKRAELGQPQQGPSPLRSLIAMFLVVGGLGLVLVYVKKAKSGKQAKRSGDSWLSGILSGGRKNQPYIEVLANHALGPKQSITVVRIRDQQFVLGVTQDSVQLITQIDSDDTEIDVLDDPKVADSLGKMFGAKVKPAPSNPKATANIRPSASFDSLLKGSTGAGAIVARNAYQAQGAGASKIEEAVGFKSPGNSPSSAAPGVRDQIRKRLQGMSSQ
jgi:flagellar biogenesis protein FliO